MARIRGGRVARPQGHQEDDPLISLFVGIVRRAQIDAGFPNDSKSPLAPSQHERATAKLFLDELYRSASRRDG